MRNKILFVLLPLAVLLCFAPGALAQSTELAQSHYMAGQAYYKQARYQDAVREFEEAYRLSKKAALLFNIAQAYERMGDLESTVTYLEKYLKHPDAKDRGAVKERLRNIKQRIAETGVNVVSAVDGATVIVDGKEIGKTPLSGPVPVTSGSHEIRVQKKGYAPFSAFVSAVHGNIVDVKVKLEPTAGGAGAQPTDGAAGSTSGGGQSVPEDAMDTSAGQADARGSGRFWTWVVGGTAAALVVTGGITGAMALGKAGEANDVKVDPTAADADAIRKDKEDKEDSAKSMALISDVTLGLGVGAAVVATVLYFYEGQEAEAPRTVVAPQIGPNQAGLSATFSF